MNNTRSTKPAISRALVQNENVDFSSLLCIPHHMWTGRRGAFNNLRGLNDHYYVYGHAMTIDAPLVHIVIDGDIMLTIRTRTHGRMHQFLNSTCEICCFTKMSCRCLHFKKRGRGTWTFSTGTDEQYLSADFHKRWLRNSQVFADWTPYDAKDNVLQSIKTVLSDHNVLGDVVKILEDVGTFIYYYRTAKTVQDIAIMLSTFIRSVTGQSVVVLHTRMLQYILSEAEKIITEKSSSFQSGPTHFEKLWDNYKMMRTSPLGQKVLAVLSHSIMAALLMKMGIEPDCEKVRLLYDKKIKTTASDYLSLADAIGNLVVFMLKQGRQYMLTGDVNCFFINGDSVTDWLTKAKKMKADFEFLSNPEAINMDVYTYLKDLKQTIEDGTSIIKACKSGTTEHKIVTTTNIELSTLEKRYLCLNAALSMRKQPLGIVLYGAPGVGKSFITDRICKLYAELFKLNPSPAYRFNHCSEDEYFTNFKSFMHTIVLDDVAQHKPTRVQGVDPSVGTLIKIFNNQPFSPPQAALDDKGKTPMLCELGIVTTNVLDMHIPHYFSQVYAVMRRLPIHIEPIVKPQYCTNGILDTSKIGTDENLWDFKIREPQYQPKCDTDGSNVNMNSIYKITKTLVSVQELHEYLTPLMIDHRKRQMRVLESQERICNSCFCVMSTCMCEKLQTSELCSICFNEHIDCHCNDDLQSDLFRISYPVEECPWRIDGTKDFRKERHFNMRMARVFQINMHAVYKSDFDKSLVNNYAHLYLPDLMRRGYDDTLIREDFVRYHAHCLNTRDANHYFVSINAPNTQSGWKYYIMKFFLYCYYEYSYFRWLILYGLNFSWTRRAFLSVHEAILSSSERRTKYMKNFGDRVDSSLKSSTLVAYVVSVMSMAMFLNLIRQTFEQSVLTKEKHRNFIRIGDADDCIERQIQKHESKILGLRKRRALNAEKAGIVVVEEQLTPSECSSSSSLCDDGDNVSEHDPLQSLEHFYDDVPTTISIDARNFGITPPSAPRDNVANVWNKDTRLVTAVDFHPQRATTLEACMKSLSRACVSITIISRDDGRTHMYEGRAICINSSTLMLNAHAVPKTLFNIKINILYNSCLGPSVEGFIDPKQVTRYDARDLVFIKTKMLPMIFNNIERQFPLASFDGIFDGFYMIIQPDGSFEKLIVNRIHKVVIDTVTSEGIHIKMEGYAGHPERPTENGECGSPLFMDTGFGPIIVGFHFMYKVSLGVCYSTKIVREDFKSILTNDVQIQCTKIEIPFELQKANISFCDFHKEGALMYHGDIAHAAVKGKSKVKKTSIADFVFSQTDFEEFHFEDDFSEPSMHRWRPQQRALSEYLSPAFGLNEVIVANCAAVLLNDILSHLPKCEMSLIHPVNIDVAVNGLPGIAYVDGIQRGTSMGWPFHTTKRKYLHKLEDVRWADGVRFCPEIEQRIQKVIDMYCSGLRMHAVFSACLKDEVVSKKKRRIDKTRVFFSCPTEFLVIVRMTFLGFTRVVQRNWKIFHCVIGMNCFSSQWHELYQQLTQFGVEHMIAGDFAGFDKKFSIAFQRWAFWIIKQICIESGNFSPTHIQVMECIEADLTNPTVNWFGMIITLLGGEVSGHQLTTVFNCFCCILYIMYCYAQKYPVSGFFENVVIFSLGDDHVVGVRDTHLEFNHTQIQSVLEAAGVGYTMAEKERESQPFIHMNEVTFLKRRFVFSCELGKVIAPLDTKSIIKMLTYHVKSKTVSENSQLAQAMVSASMEAFFHGRDSFEYLSWILDNCPIDDALKLYVESFPRFTWAENVNRYWSASAQYYVKDTSVVNDSTSCVLNSIFFESLVKLQAYGTGRNQKNPFSSSYCSESQLCSNDKERMDLKKNLARAFPEIRIHGRAELELQANIKDISTESYCCLENLRLAQTNSNTIGNDLPVPSDVTVASNETTEEQTYFMDNDKTMELDLSTPHDPTPANMALVPDLSSYLSRPAKIFTFTWGVGGTAGLLTSISPWSLFFNVVPIKNKLQNFRYIRCNLHVKFVINASQFYYGSLGAFYQPLVTDLGDKSGAAVAYTPGRQVVVSQRNHVWLNPQSVTSAEIVLPFLHYRNFLDLNANSASINMGELGIWEYAKLQSANGVTTGGVTVNAYAWATDVELSGASSAAILQGKQYTAGPVSGPASTVQKVAGRLKDIPVIGPFATATEVVAGAVGDVARFFGYTNVPITDDVKPIKSLAFHTLASSTISEPINKLSLQPDAETSVGMHHGDNMLDPLVIKDFIARESFLCGTAWSTTDSEGRVLFTSAVTPELFEFGGNAPQVATFPTPLSFASSFFQYWNGDIIFKFRIIKSQYHRGRLNICWDVGINAAPLMPSVGDPSVFNVVVDLDEEDEVEVRVPYTQAVPFLNLVKNNNSPWSNGPSPGFNYPGNGTIQVKVLNTLTAPVSTSGIVIQVFVRGAENLHFASPANLYQYESVYQLQGRMVTFNDQSIGEECYKEMFGENIISFRELLHRQSKACTYNIDKDLATNAWAGDYMDINIPINRIPRAYGYALNGWHFAVATVGAPGSYPFNYVRSHPLIKMLACFVGYKGSVNWTLNARMVGSADAATHVSVCRNTDPPSAKPTGSGFLNSASKSTVAYKMNDEGWAIDPSGASGIALTNQRTQAGLSFNIPYYNNYKFEVANFNKIYNTAVSGWGVEKDYYNIHVFRKNTLNTPDNDLSIDAYCGTGPDFDFVYFLNCPVLYWRSTSPDPI